MYINRIGQTAEYMGSHRGSLRGSLRQFGYCSSRKHIMVSRTDVYNAFKAAARARGVRGAELGQLTAFLTTIPEGQRNCFPLHDSHKTIIAFVRTACAEEGRRFRLGRFRLVAAFMPCRSRSACVGS